LGLRLPQNQQRPQARLAARDLLRAALSGYCGLPLDEIELNEQPGQALHALAADPIGLSISHARGACLVGMIEGAAIGVDLLDLDEVVDGPSAWSRSERERMARDYFGQPLLATADLAEDFARAWCRFEAGLKCLGLSLTEWNQDLSDRLAGCDIADLELPAPWIGAVAWRAR
jgi:4'-phosphopantetheinyl transferase